MRSIKVNFALNLIYNMSGLLFHIITFPYVSRILLADGVGIVQFYQSIINYITLCTALGIPLYAVREIARERDDKSTYSKTTTEILILHLFLTLVGYLIVFALITFVSRLQTNPVLFVLLSLHLILNAIGAYWFFQGIEDFKYIAIRALVIRILSMVALFIFVKNASDLLIYAMIIVAAEAGNNICNFLRLHKFIDYTQIRCSELRPLRHLKPALKIFVLNLVISIYVNLDTVMLGFMKDDTAVGYYAASTRITKSLLAIVQSLGGVLLPRFSNLAEKQKQKELKELSEKSLSLILAFSLPLTTIVVFMASPLIHMFCGNTFEPSIFTIQIMSPIIIFIAVSNIAGPQLLYSLGKESLVIKATLCGAIVNVILNVCLIPKYSQYGAGLATSFAEFVVMVMMLKFVWKYLPLELFSQTNMNYYWGTLAVILTLTIICSLGLNEWVYCITGLILAVIIYLGVLYFRKDPVLKFAGDCVLRLKRNIN